MAEAIYIFFGEGHFGVLCNYVAHHPALPQTSSSRNLNYIYPFTINIFKNKNNVMTTFYCHDVYICLNFNHL